MPRFAEREIEYLQMGIAVTHHLDRQNAVKLECFVTMQPRKPTSSWHDERQLWHPSRVIEAS
jgi:hypothetical protein